jgi:membrane-associated protease RseP (regulator of RpoE activity)
MLLTFLSTLYVGSQMERAASPSTLSELLAGWTFSVPLMAILLAHEFGHYFAGRYHRVDVSPPYFIPMPFFLLGTMGAVIRMRGEIRSRAALLDIGASGPLAGMAVALPVVIVGLLISPVEALPQDGTPYLIEGRSILYLALIELTKGEIPVGHDVMLSPTALAGWAGLLVTMINLVPVGQLDGGHIAYALFGPEQDRYSEWIRFSLPAIALLVGVAYALPAYLDGLRGERLVQEFAAGAHWLIWAGLLWWMKRAAGAKHPPTGSVPLGPGRRKVAWFTLILFALLVMPSWLRIQ